MSRPTVDLDHNCIIDLEENRPAGPDIRHILATHDTGAIDVRVVGIGASEAQRDRTLADNFSKFQNKVRAVGLDHLAVLPPVMQIGFTYIGFMVIGGDSDEALMRSIHQVLFPSWDFGPGCRRSREDPRRSLKALDCIPIHREALLEATCARTTAIKDPSMTAAGKDQL
jgi:hypothetical protein